MYTAAAHHHLTDAQPVPEQWQCPALRLLPPVLLLITMSYGIEYSLGWFGSPVLAASLPSSLCLLNLFAGRASREAEKSIFQSALPCNI